MLVPLCDDLVDLVFLSPQFLPTLDDGVTVASGDDIHLEVEQVAPRLFGAPLLLAIDSERVLVSPELDELLLAVSARTLVTPLGAAQVLLWGGATRVRLRGGASHLPRINGLG
jgi:hypothetical protein